MIKMKRKPIIAGNWKMYKNRDEALEFIFNVNLELPSNEFVETIICPPSLYVRDLVKRQEENLKIGAQNMSQFDEGAYTGELSGAMLKNVGVQYVIIGHSERRAYFNETDNSVNQKVFAALKNDLIPIVCVGEALKIREDGKHEKFVEKQIIDALDGLKVSDMVNIVIAYEPIWAIGTGHTATPKQANDMIMFIRKTIKKMFNDKVGEEIRILYGGSVNTKNIDDLLKESDIDGALVGGASLDSKSFLYLAHAAVHKEV